MKRREVLSLMSCLSVGSVLGVNIMKSEDNKSESLKGYTIRYETGDRVDCYSELYDGKTQTVIFKDKEEAKDIMEYLVAERCDYKGGKSVYAVNDDGSYYGIGFPHEGGNDYTLTDIIEIVEV